MERITKKTVKANVASINAALNNRKINGGIKLVEQYGKLSIYKVDNEGKWQKMLFIGTSREVYNYLWGMFDSLYNFI